MQILKRLGFHLFLKSSYSSGEQYYFSFQSRQTFDIWSAKKLNSILVCPFIWRQREPIISTPKRLYFYRRPTKLREGDVFTNMCLFSSWGVCMSCPRFLAGCMPGPRSIPEGMVSPQVPLRGGYARYTYRRYIHLVLTSSGGHRSVRYISYWSAFLFSYVNICLRMFSHKMREL